MKEFKGTKGKWEATKDNNVFADGKIIFAHQSNFNNDERQSNAKLIASAPEMFEMLKDAKELIGNFRIKNEIPTQNVYEKIEQLLTKITE